MDCWSKIIPEGFYDIIAYVISAIYLIFGYLYITNHLFYIKYPTNNYSWVIDLTFIFILISGLYVVGTIITTFSYWIILQPYKWILIKINKKYDNSFGYWGTQNLELKYKLPILSHEMTKRYARMIMLRNLSFVSFILCGIGIFKKVNIFSFMVFGSISFIAFCIRAIWIDNNFSIIDKLLKRV